MSSDLNKRIADLRRLRVHLYKRLRIVWKIADDIDREREAERLRAALRGTAPEWQALERERRMADDLRELRHRAG